MSPAYGCKPPDFGDALVFYGADYTSTSLQDYLAKELRKRNPDGLGLLLSIGGTVITETIKASINQELCHPFKSIRESQGPATKPRKRVGLRHV